MKINFKDMAERREPLHLTGQLDAKRFLGDRRDIAQVTPVAAELDASFDAGVLRVDGQMSGDIVFLCSRCLQEVKKHLEVPFHETFSQDKQYEDEDSDEDVFYIPQPEFDLVPYLEAAFLLEMPFVALCEEDCKGLCPVCGTNRNESDCHCNTERIDPRLADLQKFFERE